MYMPDTQSPVRMRSTNQTIRTLAPASSIAQVSGSGTGAGTRKARISPPPTNDVWMFRYALPDAIPVAKAAKAALAVPPKEIVKAFQRHYRPAQVDGMIDPETKALLAGLLDPLGRAA